jgi:hypothetical protein
MVRGRSFASRPEIARFGASPACDATPRSVSPGASCHRAKSSVSCAFDERKRKARRSASPRRRKSGERGEARDRRPLCPTDLQRSALRSTSSGSRRVRAAPLHQHPRASRRYVALFHPRLIGLSGDREAIRNAASAYKVFFAKAAGAKRGEYTIDHTAFIYLICPAGQYLGFLPPGTGPDRLAEVLGFYLRGSRPGDEERGVPAQDQ